MSEEKAEAATQERTIHLSFSGVMMALLTGLATIDEIEDDLFILSATWSHLGNPGSVTKEMRSRGFKGSEHQVITTLQELRGALLEARDATPPRAMMRTKGGPELDCREIEELLAAHGFTVRIPQTSTARAGKLSSAISQAPGLRVARTISADEVLRTLAMLKKNGGHQ